MADIYKCALAGTLTAADLSGKAQKIDSVHDRSKLTPLGAAVWKSHETTVKLLLSNGANPNGACGCRPPLWVAAARTKKNVGRMIEILLSEGADPNLPSPVDDDSTPLLSAVKDKRHPAILRALVDAGASPTIPNSKRETAENVAAEKKDRERARALLPREQRSSSRLSVLAMLTAVVLFVVAWANKYTASAAIAAGTAVVVGASETSLGGVIKKRFGLSGRVGKEIPQEVQVTKLEDFQHEMEEYIEKSKLDCFFRRNDPFLKTVIRKAINLQDHPDNTLNVEDMILLALYQPVLYCDDSGSMRRYHRIEPQNELVQRITSITTRIVPDDDGIELRFINQPTEPCMSRPSLETIGEIMQRVPFRGWTEIGTNLRLRVLEETVYAPLRQQNLKRPVLVSIITDGHPEGGPGTPERSDTIKQVILECGRVLEAHGYHRNVVRFQISQIGSSDQAADFLRALRSDPDLDEVLYCTTDRLDDEFASLRDNESRLEQWLLNLLMGPILQAETS
ncbi:hypothetical protein ASPZODRAFT_16352 [Penicilliopsis zonata CBS 506.65]|uniref:Uncharacterized protein n=1 Tax=Penicilliopsis zonata CBS 506.65 TaxID=1073090 RepID=A0A1L9SHE5_9EURO|nr:hypothetical protein ASPZODRAFT_16352 [Penicilliopsis zonata CBS 506.65]OJJ46598.1 hypothetical protein ASPZODRAFT_16352 [Penicilliopsis zonata CBS 506.65]